MLPPIGAVSYQNEAKDIRNKYERQKRRGQACCHGNKEQEETPAQLKIPALGNREIEQSKFRDAEHMLTEVDKQ